MMSSCRDFNPEIDSNLLDLHIKVDASQLWPSSFVGTSPGALKYTILVYNTDTLVCSDVRIVDPSVLSQDFVFTRRDKRLLYQVSAFVSYVVKGDGITHDQWMLLPQKYASHLRLERLPVTLYSGDMVGGSSINLNGFSSSGTELTIQGMGQWCQVLSGLGHWTLSYVDAMVIPLGEQSESEMAYSLSPYGYLTQNDYLYLFNDPLNIQIHCYHWNDGVQDREIIRTPVLQNGILTLNLND